MSIKESDTTEQVNWTTDVEFFWTSERTLVFCIGRWILPRSHRGSPDWILERIVPWDSLQRIKQSEVIQKNNCCILTCIYRNYEDAIDEILQSSTGDRDMENRLVGTTCGEERLGGVERVTWKPAFPCVKQPARGISVTRGTHTRAGGT